MHLQSLTQFNRRSCVRCRQQKIKCSGSVPCEQCKKRSLACYFDDAQQKVLVTKRYITELQQQACVSFQHGHSHSRTPPSSTAHESGSAAIQPLVVDRQNDSNDVSDSPLAIYAAPDSEMPSDAEEAEADEASSAPDQNLTNPLVSGHSQFTADSFGRPYYLGTSSNWAFARRVLSMVNEVVSGTPLPAPSLHPPYSTYDLGWDGRRTSVSLDDTALPTADFAMFLINAVKFHCGQLYHLFDEEHFMQHFRAHHAGTKIDSADAELWYVHYLLILAFGKAFIIRSSKGRRPPGADLFIHAMKLLPDMTCLCTEPIHSIEVLCCAALYLQCVDLRNPAYNLIGQAMRLALEQGLHTSSTFEEQQRGNASEGERYREAWWTVYMLDRHMSSLMGAPVALADDEITAQLPSFAGYPQKRVALEMQVRLSRVTTLILRTVYGRDGRLTRRFLLSMKEALKILADINDERNRSFPLHLGRAASGISRLSAPLLFLFWQKRLAAFRPLRVRSKGGCRSLLRICAQSAQHTINILGSLHSQSLLGRFCSHSIYICRILTASETFIPFDLESAFSSAIVLMITATVDPSLIRKETDWLPVAYGVLEEMEGRGNLVAGLRKSELEHLDKNLKSLPSAPMGSAVANEPENQTNLLNGPFENPNMADTLVGGDGPSDIDTLCDWNSEEALNGEQLMAVADSLDFSDLDWLSAGLADVAGNTFL
ncbi:hypothetical protein D0869_03702 [Hortaea werneckii]|uniref:Zn(2)-C6 fungal-type domain-containing protein n=1 Tax=Hortaea werneckii TaxID=91943 RepID=A0A3M6X4R2_HORWE|nr:hypothetical protein D0869_03702 [Hortaea werneckii]